MHNTRAWENTYISSLRPRLGREKVAATNVSIMNNSGRKMAGLTRVPPRAVREAHSTVVAGLGCLRAALSPEKSHESTT